jgi:hypothetical protein
MPARARRRSRLALSGRAAPRARGDVARAHAAHAVQPRRAAARVTHTSTTVVGSASLAAAVWRAPTEARLPAAAARERRRAPPAGAASLAVAPARPAARRPARRAAHARRAHAPALAARLVIGARLAGGARAAAPARRRIARARQPDAALTLPARAVRAHAAAAVARAARLARAARGARPRPAHVGLASTAATLGRAAAPAVDERPAPIADLAAQPGAVRHVVGSAAAVRGRTTFVAGRSRLARAHTAVVSCVGSAERQVVEAKERAAAADRGPEDGHRSEEDDRSDRSDATRGTHGAQERGHTTAGAVATKLPPGAPHRFAPTAQ